jgi:hypothetical protein
MSTRRLEEILEECLSAYLDGRRSVEESLSLYPSFSRELEPLLRTATSINATLDTVTPPAHVQERGLHRFLSDARARNSLKALKVSGAQPGRFSVIWQKYRLGFAGAGMALLILAASIGGTALMGDGAGNGTVFPVNNDSPTPAVVVNLRQQVDTVRTRKENQSLTADDIRRLLSAAEDLRNAPASDIEPARETISQALNDANALVAEIIATNPTLAQPAQEASEKFREVASAIDVTLSPTPVVTVTATDTPTSQPTDAPTPTVAPTPTEEPTPEPTADPMATSSPEEEPPPRAPAVIE